VIGGTGGATGGIGGATGGSGGDLGGSGGSAGTGGDTWSIDDYNEDFEEFVGEDCDLPEPTLLSPPRTTHCRIRS
jgi:hypothetical protein